MYEGGTWRFTDVTSYMPGDPSASTSGWAYMPRMTVRRVVVDSYVGAYGWPYLPPLPGAGEAYILQG
jgi:hypothetical protein